MSGMDVEPTKAYVYQPEPANSSLSPRLYGVSGPGSEPYSTDRMTQTVAQHLADEINRKAEWREYRARQITAYHDRAREDEYYEQIGSEWPTTE